MRSGSTVPSRDHLMRTPTPTDNSQLPVLPSGQHGLSALKPVEEEPGRDRSCAKALPVQGQSPRKTTATLSHVI